MGGGRMPAAQAAGAPGQWLKRKLPVSETKEFFYTVSVVS